MIISSKYTLFLIGLFLICNLSIRAQSNISVEKVDSSFYIYLAMGQSNMAGRGKVEGKYSRLKHRRVFMFDKEQRWVKARHPVHFDKPKIAGVGPILSFGIEMAKAHKGKKIGLVPCAVGGTSIQLWKPGAYDDRTDTHPWDDAEQRIKEAMRSGLIKGVIWHQGESDAAPDKAAHYLEDLKELILRVRKLVGDPYLPFVAGELGRYKAPYENINEVLGKLPDALKHTVVASSEGLSAMEDGVHFNSVSADLLGRRMAVKMEDLERSGPN